MEGEGEEEEEEEDKEENETKAYYIPCIFWLPSSQV